MSKTIEHDGCVGCKYEHFKITSSYCQGCKQNAVDKYTRMTNADRIKNMDNDELASFLCKVKADYQWSEHEFPDDDACGDWQEWLKSEVEE